MQDQQNLLEKMLERLEGMSSDLAVIKVKQEKMEEDFDKLEGDIQELRSEIKQLNDRMYQEINTLNEKISNRERALAGAILTSLLGLVFWFVQESISK